jgi:hypothetical protein
MFAPPLDDTIQGCLNTITNHINGRKRNQATGFLHHNCLIWSKEGRDDPPVCSVKYKIAPIATLKMLVALTTLTLAAKSVLHASLVPSKLPT